MTVPYLPSGGSTQAEMQPHSSVAARATGKVGRKSWRSFCSGSRYAGSGKQRRSMRGGLLFISALPQSTHTITSPRPRPIKVLLTTNMLPRCQGLTVANGDAIERLDHSDAGIPMKPGSLDSQHYRAASFVGCSGHSGRPCRSSLATHAHILFWFARAGCSGFIPGQPFYLSMLI